MSTFNDTRDTTYAGAEFQSPNGYMKRDATGAPAVAGNTNVHAAITLPATGTTTVTTAITSPDVPRTLRIKGNASGITGNVVIVGTDINDNAVTDTIASSGTGAVDGVKVFKTVTSIQVPAKVNSSGDTISVGFGPGLGFSRKLPADTVLAVTVDGVYETTRPTVAYDVTNSYGNYYTPNTTPNGTKVFAVYYISLELKA